MLQPRIKSGEVDMDAETDVYIANGRPTSTVL